MIRPILYAALLFGPACTLAAVGTTSADVAAATPGATRTVPTRDGHFSPNITAADFAARLKTVSSDAFLGRKPGTEGETITTKWLVDQFKAMGLAPGNDGDWFQPVPMVITTLDHADDVALSIFVQRLAQAADMDVDGADFDVAVMAPNCVEQPFA